MALARVKKKARADAYNLAKAQSRGKVINGPLKVTLTFTPPGNYGYDDDNMVSRCKAHRDGIADAIGVDDRHWRLGEPKWNPAQKPGWVTYTIEEIT